MTNRPDADLDRRFRTTRLLMADLAERRAEVSERFAAYVEHAAERADSERRLALAEAEYELAKIERRNATRLRETDGQTPLHLEHLPALPGFRAPRLDAEPVGE